MGQSKQMVALGSDRREGRRGKSSGERENTDPCKSKLDNKDAVERVSEARRVRPMAPLRDSNEKLASDDAARRIGQSRSKTVFKRLWRKTKVEGVAVASTNKAALALGRGD